MMTGGDIIHLFAYSILIFIVAIFSHLSWQSGHYIEILIELNIQLSTVQSLSRV